MVGEGGRQHTDSCFVLNDERHRVGVDGCRSHCGKQPARVAMVVSYAKHRDFGEWSAALNCQHCERVVLAGAYHGNVAVGAAWFECAALSAAEAEPPVVSGRRDRRLGDTCRRFISCAWQLCPLVNNLRVTEHAAPSFSGARPQNRH